MSISLEEFADLLIKFEEARYEHKVSHDARFFGMHIELFADGGTHPKTGERTKPNLSGNIVLEGMKEGQSGSEAFFNDMKARQKGDDSTNKIEFNTTEELLEILKAGIPEE